MAHLAEEPDRVKMVLDGNARQEQPPRRSPRDLQAVFPDRDRADAVLALGRHRLHAPQQPDFHVEVVQLGG